MLPATLFAYDNVDDLQACAALEGGDLLLAELEHLVGFGPTWTKSLAYKASAIGRYATGAYLSKISA